MGSRSEERNSLFCEFSEAMLQEVEKVGSARFRRDAVVSQFEGRASRRTLYRWAAEILDSSAPALHLEKRVAEAVASRAKPDASSLEHDVAATRPRPPVNALAAVSEDPDRPLRFMTLVESCVRDAQDVLAFARTADGNVRNAKLVILGSQHLLRTLEVAGKIQREMNNLAHLERFHAEIIAEIRMESPALAERVVRRLQILANKNEALSP